MKIFIIFLFTTIKTSQLASIGNRRQAVSYTNSVIHQDPKYPDQRAQSTVKVSFNPSHHQLNEDQYHSFTRSKNVQDYTRNPHQSFNVGYSVRFTNSPHFQKPVKNLDDGEIITGVNKVNEEVEKPTNFAQDYVSNALLDKQHKISGIKPKTKIQQIGYVNPNTVVAQANLAPITQKYFKALNQVPSQKVQDLQERYSWKHLGPNVEIIRSTEVPSYQFDHAKALGRGQTFDYSNAVTETEQKQEYQQEQQQNTPTLFYNTRKVPHTQLLRNIPKLPVDTRLLKEPVLMTDVANANNDPAVIPIHFDTRLIQEAMQKHFVNNYPLNQYLTEQSSQQNQESEYYQQQPKTNKEPEYYQEQPKQNQEPEYYQQQSKQNQEAEYYQQKPKQNQEQDYYQRHSKPVVIYNKKDQEYEPQQSQYQYKVYSKPQLLKLANDKANIRDIIQRQPRYLEDLQTNLRPPPFNVNYQRRLYLG